LRYGFQYEQVKRALNEISLFIRHTLPRHPS
jgi:hypothetical protein